ncbi:MAG TPA: hypothetical protein VGG53_09585 [Mycobacterium sp.]|jgi:hypothetical protein|uniref:hypothetical protein n=1 Tax=Mycobacterium sp. TaxID=1785 RepID=UPI002F41A702
MTLVLGTAAGAFLAAGLTSLATLPIAHADDGDALTLATLADPASFDPASFAPASFDPVSFAPAAETDFISNVDKLFSLFGVTDIEAADADDGFAAMVVNIPSLGITDVLTSGADPSDMLATTAAGLGITLPDDIGVGTAGVTVNTFIDSMDTALNSTFTIPFTDPLEPLWVFLVENAFFGL